MSEAVCPSREVGLQSVRLNNSKPVVAVEQGLTRTQQCPTTNNGVCSHPYCKFLPDQHPPNTKFKPTYPCLDVIESN